MKKTFSKSVPLWLLMVFLLYSPIAQAGIPACHILLCCRENNRGMTFLVDGKWNPNHTYADINQVSDILQKVKEAGISLVILDMTNPSQWEQYWKEFQPMVNNVQQVCQQKNMQFFVFLGAFDSVSYWNKQAEKVWNLWAQSTTYRRYGFDGDDRPMLLCFQPSDLYWNKYNAAPAADKTYLSRFHIGTTQVNDPIVPGESDGWGYRNYSQNASGSVRFASPNGGVNPKDPWYKVSVAEWTRRVNWAREASKYSVYGSYDDTCDAINFGIADTRHTSVSYNKYPGDDPYCYYNVVKNALINGGGTPTQPVRHD
jgi:hypothetical protein